MPDFDPKTIPTLDDVIETVKAEDAENKASENDGIEPDTINHESALFTAEPVINLTADIDDESIQPELDIEESIDSNITSGITSETEIIESALIDYNTEDESDSSIEDETANADKITHEIDTPPKLPIASQPLISTDELQAITDDVVNQLLPDLEQHLRKLIHQALEEKLPPDLISPEATSNTNIED